MFMCVLISITVYSKKKLVMNPIKIANILSDNKELLLKADVIN